MLFQFNHKAEPVRSPGGSTIFQYARPVKSDLRFAEQASAEEIDRRTLVYRRLFGGCENVSHETQPEFPHIDVCQFKGDRAFHTLVTSGMSDLPMHLEPTARGKASPRVELIFYTHDPRPEYMDALRWLAHFPHAYQTWVGHGHTIPNGNPPALMWNSKVLDSVLLMPTIVTCDQTLNQELTICGDAVEFLWVVPLSRAECQLKLAHGFEAVLELFGRHNHPHVFQPGRDSYC